MTTEVFVRKSSGFIRQISGYDAMVTNAMMAGLLYGLQYIVWNSNLYPGSNFAVTFVIALIPNLIIGVLYILMTVSMPRTGGDYVWVSRTLHPSLGFLANFTATFAMAWGATGLVVPWGANPGLSGLLAALGLMTGNKSYYDASSWFMSPNGVFIYSTIIIMVLLSIVLFLGTKFTFRFAWLMFALSLIGGAALFLLCETVGPAGFTARFNALSGTTVSNVIADAKVAGAALGFTVAGTVMGINYASMNYLGVTFSAYHAGEMKSVRRDQTIAIIGSSLLFCAMCTLLYLGAYYAVGSDLMQAISYLSMAGKPVGSLTHVPTLNYLTVFLTDNPIVLAIVSLGYIATCIGGPLAYNFVGTRVMFAWAFDRIFPASVTTLHKRFRSPWIAIIVINVFSWIVAWMYAYTTLLAYLEFTLFAWWIAMIIVGLACAVFPYVRKDIFEASPGIVKAKLAGVPWVSILGVLTMIWSIYLASVVLAPYLAGLPTAPRFAEGVIVFMVVVFVIYWISRAINRARGIPIELAFKEVPPE